MLETLAGALLFYRGKAGISSPSKLERVKGSGPGETLNRSGRVTRLYKRWHASGLLAVALLGALAIRADENTEGGEAVRKTTSYVLAAFHTCCVVAAGLAIRDEAEEIVKEKRAECGYI